MIDELTLQQIEARCDAPLVEWQAIHADVRLLLAAVRALQQPPAPGDMVMTFDEWKALSAESRLRLNKWLKELEKAAQALSGAGDDIERLQAKLDRIGGWCKAYPLDVFPEPDFALARQLLEAGGISLDAVSASNMRHVVEGIARIINEEPKGDQNG